ncbi:MAG TPA: Ig-like domain repeat protein, partial [Candidatus Rifleibacterium sp.]|nr:Ig-like domain repeat protein [Candidatus Rifleibacterium sp.]
GSVWVNLEKLGGAASSTLSPYGTAYRLDHVISDPLIGGIVDQSMSFPVYAVDDSGNTVVTTTGNLHIDNEPPLILTSSYTVNPVLSASHPYVKAGDRLTFKVQLASSSSSIYDGQTVKIYLNELGQATPVEMTYAGGYYTTSITVMAGTLNYEHYFSFTATDNNGNEKSGVIQVPVDNSVPDVGPMGVNFLTDQPKAGVVNVGDRLEFIIPANDKDEGFCVLDLSMVGGSSTTILTNYDTVLKRYYIVHDCVIADVENPSYVFKAIVYDKAGNVMNSLSPTFTVDCRMPSITSFIATVSELKGKAGVINTGDKVKFTAEVDLSLLDDGIPTVNLTALGGNAAQQLYDDGAHNDGIANDGVCAFTHTVIAGETDGEDMAFTLLVTDNAGNRITSSAGPFHVDNKALVISSVTNIQKQDTNGNTIIDLDGKYTTAASYATDSVVLRVLFTGNTADNPLVTVDLTKLGHNEIASTVPWILGTSGFEAEVTIEPRVGTTNNEDVKLTVKVTDQNGNETVAQAVNAVKVDNKPPTIEVYPITFVSDGGRLGEANLGDVIQIKVKMTNHDGILPMIDFVNLYTDNGLTPPSPTLFPPSPTGGNEFTYNWSIPQGLGTLSSLVIIALDASGNMAYAYTLPVRFLSKTPTFAGYPQTRADLISDVNQNNIINPGDSVKITCVLDSIFNINNAPPAEVLVDIRSLTNSTSDDSQARYYDGDSKTWWVPLTFVNNVGSPYVYNGTFVASSSLSGLDATTVAFNAKVLHPDTPAIVMATTIITTNPDQPFGIDTQVPALKIGSVPRMQIVEENGDNLASYAANISDIIAIQAEIERLSDPGSVTVVISKTIGGLEVYRAPMFQIVGSNLWGATITLATGTRNNIEPLADGEWRIVDGDAVNMRIYMSDDADNLATSAAIIPSPVITFDNKPPLINKSTITKRIQSFERNNEAWVANAGNGVASDSISAWVDMLEPTANSKAWVDFTMIGATSTYMLKPNAVNATRFETVAGVSYPDMYAHLNLDSDAYDLATHTFRIYVMDRAGNKDYVEDIYNQLAVDTRRPEVTYASYDNGVLSIWFSEMIQYQTFNIDYVRIGYKPDQTDVQLSLGSAVQLNSAADLLFTDTDSTVMNIQLDSQTKAAIADWGKKTLYISLATNNVQTALDNFNPIGKDVAGNWIRPISRNITLTTVDIPNDYTVRPNLIGGRYVANLTDADRRSLYLEFDKDIDPTTLTPASLQQLAIWYNKSSSNETWANAYRFNTLALDTFDPNDTENTSKVLRIEISQEAQDWIALKYGRLGSQIHFQINGTDYEPPPYPSTNPTLVRDFEGNSVKPILPANAVAAALTPLNTSFQISSNITLDLSSADPMLTINMQNRRARLFDDTYSESTLTIARTRPVDLSRVYIYEKAETNTGRSISLGSITNVNPMVKWTGTGNYSDLNDFASTTVRIPLTAEALKTILSWGTSEFYLACSTSAFKDLWGNGSDMYPGTTSTGAKLTTIKPSGYTPAKIHTVAVTPVKPDSALFKGQPADGFVYEIAFDTATLSADVRVPIARDIQPTLELFRQDNNERLDTGRFIGWLEHNQGGVTRTAIQFANTGLAQSGNHQKVPVYVRLTGFTDIFNVDNRQNGQASAAFDLSKKVTTSDYQYGFNQVTSYTMVFDNAAPYALQASSPATIGVTGAGNLKVTVDFNEAMDATNSSAFRPTLRLLQGSSTVMSFAWSRWVDSDTAEFVNSGAFDSSTAQGVCFYAVTGGYDEAGNKGSDKTLATSVTIHSKGPSITAFKVQTLQSTTANYADDYAFNAPYSPNVSSDFANPTNLPGVATISIEFSTFPVDATGWVRIYSSDGNTLINTLSAAPSSSGSTWQAVWNGTKSDGQQISGELPITYELRFYDLAGNEGSRRGSIVYDVRAPRVAEWQFPNLKVLNNKAYYSPTVTSMAKINAITGDIGQGMKMRLTKTGERINTYVMSSFSSSGYTLNFDGKSTDSVPANLSGSYEVTLVDLAGNLGVPLTTNSRATATLVIDRDVPVLERINMYRVAKGTNVAIGDAVTRFNSRKNDLRIEVVEGTYLTEPLGSGTAVIKIMSGSTLLREIITQQVDVLSPLFAIWDGNDNNGQPVNDGTYRVTVSDLAGNTAALGADITIVRSVFKLESVSQVGLNGIRMTFSHDVLASTAEASTKYAIKPIDPTGLLISGIKVSTTSPRVVTASITPALGAAQNGKLYTVTVTPLAVFSVDGDEITAGNNEQSFTADSRGPIISAITYDGVTSQKKFNVVFDEQLESSSALNAGNYKLSLGSTNVSIDEAVIRADLKSVTLTAASDITEGQTYSLTVTGVKDLTGNSSESSITFEGRDITPPVLTLTAFSNPANEFDIILVVKANEDISGQPAATITQSGGTAVSLLLNSGNDLRMFIGGAHLDRNYPGVATIKVSATDISQNAGTANLSFSTAFVNASMRAAVRSADSNVEAVFEPGTLNGDSLVMILPEALSKENSGTTTGSRIMPSALAGMSAAQISSIRASRVAAASDRAAGELEPIGQAYSLIIPAGRLTGSVAMSMQLDAPPPVGSALYQSDVSGWKAVDFTAENNSVRFTATTAGTFAMMRDVQAPRASMVKDITAEPLRESRPVFSWNLEEYASGIDTDSAVAVLNGRQYPVMIDSTGSLARFVPVDDLISGNHTISLRIADKAGNQTVLPTLRFVAQPPLIIHEVVQFPNPARNRVSMRISTNRTDVDADEIRVKIYDTAGHLVIATNDLVMRSGNNGAGKVVQDVIWDLRNKDGKAVANGVYFAKIELKDPDNHDRKTKYTHKIAVLR